MKEKIIAILNDLRPEFSFTEDVDFIEEGMLDSFDIVSSLLYSKKAVYNNESEVQKQKDNGYLNHTSQEGSDFRG